MTQVASDSLLWIKTELDSTLLRARHALEAYVENQDDKQKLEECLLALHQVQGTLRMVEVYGAAMLAQEMEQVAKALVDGKVEEPEDAYEVLMRAMLQLPDYLERIVSGQRDLPLALLSLLNDLRSVRGEALLSESTVFAQGLSDRGKQTIEARDQQPQGDIKEIASKLRSKFQQALLGWFKSGDAKTLKQIQDITEQFEMAATSPMSFQLWWVVSGTIEALVDGGIEASVSLKQMLGQVDRQIKRVIDQGEDALDDDPPSELINNLLYYVGKSASTGERVSGIKEAFRLGELLPSDEDMSRASQDMSGPNASLMKTVSAAIKEDLARVKDTLDIFVRMGKNDPVELTGLAELMKKVSDTLGVLGLGSLRERIDADRQLLDKIIGGTQELNENILMDIAGSLIRVESSLDERMVETVFRENSATPGDDESQGLRVEEADFNQVSSAVIRESIINLARVKDAISEFIKSPTKDEILRPVPPLIHQIQAGLRLLEIERAADLLESVRHYIQQRIFGSSETPSDADLDRFADAIVSVEFYLETVQQGRGYPESMLDNAESCVKALGFPLGYVPDDADSDDAEPEDSISPPPEPARKPEAAAPEPAAKAPPAPAPVERSHSIGPQPDEVDPEIVEIFLEESREELASLQEHFPHWKKNPEHQDSLSTVRRSFHTLKGSGRMVGAELIGEFAWSIENMLNRVIDQTIYPSDAMFDLIESVIEKLPQLIEQLEVGTEPDFDPYALMERANAIASGQEAESGEESEIDRQSATMVDAAEEIGEAVEEATDQAPAIEEPVEEDVEEDVPPPETSTATGKLPMDEVLYGIFSAEASALVDKIENYVESGEAATGKEIIDDLLRALHTLNGSAAMAGAHSISEMVDPFEQYLKIQIENQQPLQAEDIALLQEIIGVVRRQVSSLEKSFEAVEGLEKATTKGRKLLIAATEAHASSSETAGEATSKPSSQPAPAPAPPAPPRELKVVDINELEDFDEELAEVFLEEASEVLEGSDAALEQWSNAQNDVEPVEELQRLLHTLKGGARMAGITPMGDLAHEIETLMAKVTDGHLPVSTRMFSLMQRAIDRLHRMNEQVMGRAPIVEASDLVDEFHALMRGEDAPEGESSVDGSEAAAQAPSQSAEAATEAAEPEPESTAQPEMAVSDFGKRERLPGEPFDPKIHFDRRNQNRIQQEVVRVRADLIENLINNAGEVSIYRSRLEQQVNTIGFNLAELDQTVVRLREQLRNLEIETEAQVLSQWEKEGLERTEEFDPLEMDRYSTLQQLSRALAESVSDLVSIQGLLLNQSREAETLLLQQSRVNTALQDGLMRTRMVPFSKHAQRLRRIVRQTADEIGKQAELQLSGAEGEMDRQILERVLAPLEHMMRNSVVHGIESPEVRKKAGKPEQGTVYINLTREGSEVVLRITDDGAGLNVDAIRKKAEKQGLLRPGAKISDNDVMQFILESGFSTAEEITQAAGRGVGMDVVYSEIKQLGGSLVIASQAGKGAEFVIRLPFTLAITQALMVTVADDTFAIPLPTIEGIVRLPRKDVMAYFDSENPSFSYGGDEYSLEHLSALLGMGIPKFPEELDTIPVLLVKAGDHNSALVTEGMQGSREIVVKSVGPQISSIRGIAGATLLGDGSILLILDAAGLVRAAAAAKAQGAMLDAGEREEAQEDERTLAMVVDDSITVRRVTQRLLERYGMRVITAKDGVDALSVLQESIPDVMLLDIEMPRMDGFELATHIRNDDRLQGIPIIMITSRTGEKHRNRAMEIGVNKYLGKPYQEGELVEQIQSLVGKFNPERTRWD
ncbi:MAG: Hpt domain-containing protein [Gammaproteobacteria bacterium]|nr:Hpt domain-containing protein [Gammaproteobacteria bacterium]